MKRPVSETRAESFVARVNKKFDKNPEAELYQHPETVDAALGLIALVANAHWTEGNDRMQNAAFQSYLAIGEELSVAAVSIDSRSGVIDPQKYTGTNLKSAFTVTVNRSAELLKAITDNGGTQSNRRQRILDSEAGESPTVVHMSKEFESFFASQTIHGAVVTLYDEGIIGRKQAEGLLVLLEEVDVSKLNKAAVMSAKMTTRRDIRSKINKSKNTSSPLLSKIVGDTNNGTAPKDVREVVGAEVIKRGTMKKDVEKLVRGVVANELNHLFRDTGHHYGVR